METKDYLRILKDEIHSVVIATVDGEGRPAARVIDIMLTDDRSLYFITAKGKAFYEQLMGNPYVAVSGMCGGAGTMHKKAVSIRGKAVNLGAEKLKEVFEQNPYMAEIYPQEESRSALEVKDSNSGAFYSRSAVFVQVMYLKFLNSLTSSITSSSEVRPVRSASPVISC